MPLRDFKCAKCDKVQERYYTSAYPTCDCGGELEMQPLANTILGKTGVFPFVSPHIDGTGKPVVVESMAHLRKIERQYGVTLTAFSQNPNNPDSIKDPPRHRVGGREYYQ